MLRANPLNQKIIISKKFDFSDRELICTRKGKPYLKRDVAS